MSSFPTMTMLKKWSLSPLYDAVSLTFKVCEVKVVRLV